MPDHVHPAVNAVQASRPDTVADRIAAESERQQLPARHDSVLSLGQGRDRAITWQL